MSTTQFRRRLAVVVLLAALDSLLLTPAAPALAHTVTNQSGPVLPFPGVYVVFWGSEWTNTADPQYPQYQQYATYLTDFLTNLGGTPWLNTVQQYGAANPSGQLLGTWFDDTTDPEPPTIPIWSDIDTEAIATLQHFLGGFFQLFPNQPPINLNTAVLVALPSGHDPNDFPTNGGKACAWHSYDESNLTVNGTLFTFAFISLPWQPDSPTCFAGGTGAVGDSYGHNTLDGVSYSAGHEYAEAITDPYGSAWYDLSQVQPDGTNLGEIGDLCA